MKEAGFSGDVRKLGGIDLPTIQRFINLWFSLSLDLHGNEISTNAASYFANGLKGRAQEEKWDDHLVTEQFYELDVPAAAGEGRLERKAIPMRTAMNEVLRDWYCRRLRGRRPALEPHPRAPRHVGSPAAARSQVQPRHRHVLVAALRSATASPLSDAEWERRKHEWLPAPPTASTCSASWREPVYEPGKFANYIAPPLRGHQPDAD